MIILKKNDKFKKKESFKFIVAFHQFFYAFLQRYFCLSYEGNFTPFFLFDQRFTQHLLKKRISTLKIHLSKVLINVYSGFNFFLTDIKTHEKKNNENWLILKDSQKTALPRVKTVDLL